MKTIAIVLALACALPGASYALEKGATRSINLPAIDTGLKDGKGKEKVVTYCNICHSVDYITMQPPLTNAQWTATVNKMIKVFGAPIGEEDAKAVIDYLAAQYGTKP